MRPMTRHCAGRGAAVASAEAVACPLCLGGGQPSKAQQLVAAPHAVLAVPTADASRFRVIQVIKGERPASGTVEGGYPRSGPAPGRGAERAASRCCSCVTTRCRRGSSSARSTPVRRAGCAKLAAGKRAADMSPEEWRARVALVVPYLDNPEPLAADIAYAELAAAPYAALRTAKPRLDAAAVRQWLADPELAARQPLYLLLLGIAGNAQDAAALEQRLQAAWESGDATNLGAMLAADLELRGAGAHGVGGRTYLADPKRSTLEIEAALLALSVHGNANGAIPRERVIQSYRMFIKEHPEIAGFVAPDLAAWQVLGRGARVPRADEVGRPAAVSVAARDRRSTCGRVRGGRAHSAGVPEAAPGRAAVAARSTIAPSCHATARSSVRTFA